MEQSEAFINRYAGDKNALNRFNILAEKKEKAEKKVDELLAECNTFSNLIEDLRAENKILRKLSDVPANYGIPIDEIKLHDKETIDDYKRLIRELQNDNYNLE